MSKTYGKSIVLEVLPDMIMLNTFTHDQLCQIQEEHEKWDVRLFTPSGLSMLFPTLKGKKRA